MKNQYILITGGAGFIGTNVALSYLEQDRPVHIFDNLSRSGVEENIRHLLSQYPGRVLFTEGDIRDRRAIEEAVETASAVFHLAAQVAVTTSLKDPVLDAQTNLTGTLQILEAIRHSDAAVPLLFTSTNKVYGNLGAISFKERGARYLPAQTALAEAGIDERQPLDFLSPYGCSKGSADQYVLDYARSYGMSTTVFRMSCIYGPYQLGSEDQGWVAHFIRQAMKNEPITIYGNGKQVRDLLYVSDLVRAMRSVIENIREVCGEAFNVGGGPGNSASLLEVIAQIRALSGASPTAEFGPERLGDQRWYVSDINKIGTALNWKPQISIEAGLAALIDWYNSRPELTAQTRMQVA